MGQVPHCKQKSLFHSSVLMATQVIGHPVISSLPQWEKKDWSRPNIYLKFYLPLYKEHFFESETPPPNQDPNHFSDRPLLPRFLCSHHDVDGVCGRNASC